MSKRKSKPLPRWRVIAIRGAKPDEICIIPAANADAAVKAAIKEMAITDPDRIHRLAARPAD